MVKITKSFEFLHPIEKKVPSADDPGYTWQSRALLLRGRAALLCLGPHPIYQGWYKLHLNQGRLQIEITFREIIDLTANKDCLLELRENPEMIAAFTEMAEQYMKDKFLSFYVNKI